MKHGLPIIREPGEPPGGWEKKAVNWTRLVAIAASIAAAYWMRSLITPIVDRFVH